MNPRHYHAQLFSDPQAPASKHVQKLSADLKSAKEEMAVMRELSAIKEAKLFTLERKFLDLDHRYKTEMEQKNGQIKDLSAELNDKASQIVQLTTQVRTFATYNWKTSRF